MTKWGNVNPNENEWICSFDPPPIAAATAIGPHWKKAFPSVSVCRLQIQLKSNLGLFRACGFIYLWCPGVQSCCCAGRRLLGGSAWCISSSPSPSGLRRLLAGLLSSPTETNRKPVSEWMDGTDTHAKLEKNLHTLIFLENVGVPANLFGVYLWKQPILKAKNQECKHITCWQKSVDWLWVQTAPVSCISFNFLFSAPPGDTAGAKTWSCNTCDAL